MEFRHDLSGYNFIVRSTSLANCVHFYDNVFRTSVQDSVQCLRKLLEALNLFESIT